MQALGSSVEGRVPLVSGMLERDARDAMSYWLQLVVSIGIATLGLVVGSAAVIIGAMLVAPLMVPILSLAMGLATGSPFLVLRASSRILLSVAVAVGGAGLITVLLPFHELNQEIAARTAPTVLDLLTAGFCALAGVYASLRPGSDTATTAAGTSIGISLVPPLCASGYGLGTGTWAVAGGAALLFLTNLVAIIFVGTVSFVAAGFNRVPSASLERDELARQQGPLITAAIARKLARLFESKAGPALRFSMPFVLLASVYIPLRRALDEVAWEVRARAAVQQSLERERHQIVQSRVRVDRHEVELLVVLVGTTAQAEASRKRLHAEIERAARVTPRVEVLGIPDSGVLAGLETTLRNNGPLTLPAAVSSPEKQLDSARSTLREKTLELWPAATAGEPLEIEFGGEVDEPILVRVLHLGSPLGADAIEGLERSLTSAFGGEVRLQDVAVPIEPLTRAGGDLRFVSKLSAALAASAGAPAVSVCVVQPDPAMPRARADARETELGETLTALLAAHRRVTWTTGAEWNVRFVRGACPTPPAPPASTLGTLPAPVRVPAPAPAPNAAPSG